MKNLSCGFLYNTTTALFVSLQFYQASLQVATHVTSIMFVLLSYNNALVSSVEGPEFILLSIYQNLILRLTLNNVIKLLMYLIHHPVFYDSEHIYYKET